MIKSPSTQLLVRDLDRDVARAFQNSISSTLSTWTDTLHCHALIYEYCRYTQFVDVSTIIVLCVCNCRLKHLLNQVCTFFGAERQNVQSFANRLATNLVSNQTGFLSGDAGAVMLSNSFHHQRLIIAWLSYLLRDP